MAGRQHAVPVAARDEHQRPVDRHDLVEKHRDVHRPRLGHAVVARPGAVILVPLPHVAVERRLGVDLELMHVELLAEQLLDRLDQARMRAEQAKALVVGMRGKGGARRPGFLLPHFRPTGMVDQLGLAAQRREAELIYHSGRPEVWKEKSGAPRTAFAAHTYNEGFRLLGSHPRLIEPVEQLFGEKLYMHQFKVNAKAAFDGDVWQWHQDYGTWARDDGMPEP